MIEVVDDHDLGLKQPWRLGVFNTRGLGLFLVSHKKIGENRGKHRNLISSKISKVIYHYFRIGCGTLFWGCMGVLYLYRDGSAACNPGDSPTEGTQKKHRG